jgi:glycosyltransferase involved in cell wall biosynthesis
MSITDQPCIAVLTTLYRGDSTAFFEDAFASLQAQTYPREQTHVYVCVDGPLPRSHETLLEKYSNQIYKVVRNPRNMGIATALNRGLDALEDESYVLRMDMDDLCDPQRFTSQVTFMQSNADIDLCGCNSIEIDASGGEVFRRRYPATDAEIKAVLHRCNPILHPTYCIRRDSLRSSALRYRNRFLVEDLDFVLQCAKRGWKFYNLQDFLFRWRLSSEFYARRHSLKRAAAEFCVYSECVWYMHRIDPRMVFPAMRFLFRLLPPTVTKRMYRSQFRNRALGGSEW